MMLKFKRKCSESGCRGQTRETFVGNRGEKDGKNVLRTVTFKNYFPADFNKAMDSKLHLKQVKTRCLRNTCKGNATLITEVPEMPKLLVVDGHKCGWNMLFSNLPKSVQWNQTRFELRGIVLHSPREKHFQSVTVLPFHYLFHCGMKCPNSRVLEREKIEASEDEGRKVQGLGYWVSLAIFETVE